MATKQDILSALGWTEAQADSAGKIGAALVALDSASVAAGGAGYSVSGLASGIAISGLNAQIVAYRETVEAQRAQAVADNAAAETGLQTDLARIATLSVIESPTTGDLVEKAGLEAKAKRVRAESAARTAAAEVFAQGVAPIVAELEGRLRRLATGDLSAV